MGKGKVGTHNAKISVMCGTGGIQKNMNASPRLPITRIPPSHDMSPSEKLSWTERFRSPEDDFDAQSLAKLEKSKEIKTN